MKQEGLAVMWEMGKLGYRTEEIQQVIKLANGTSPADGRLDFEATCVKCELNYRRSD